MSAISPERGSTPLPLPRAFGPQYVLVDRIGVGGMAEIYLARRKTQSDVSRLAVVKLVLPLLARDERFSTLLVQEAKLAAQLSHGNIVQTYDLGRQDGQLYIAMEYVEGFDLNELLKRCSKAKVPLPASFALFVVRETLAALDYAHRKRNTEGRPLNLVHRDVSPSNVLVSFEGEVKLCDFGIARALDAREGRNDSIEGKASYMAPEHARGDSVDARADVFSASVILWELLAGRRMYRSEDGVDLLTLARRGEVPPLPDRPLPHFEVLRRIVHQGLARSPADRFESAAAMLHALDDYRMEAEIRTSPMDLGEWVVEHFGQEIITLRRAREQAAIALEGRVGEEPQQTPLPAAEPDPIRDILSANSQSDSHALAYESSPPSNPIAGYPSTFPPMALPSMIPSMMTAPLEMIPMQPPAPSVMPRVFALAVGALITLAIGIGIFVFSR
ncbi:MAG: protein kinase [Deltaproteobacteria bacterium]|nr:protein kinase [Deltaproteobacteria bacterium]